jgi:3-deoxy-D-manno-octulosonic-acid transferase
MTRILFIFLIISSNILRPFVSIILILLKNVSKNLKDRIEFERKNIFQVECQSFRLIKQSAHYCFEVSSEGELEQVRPLIEYYLGQGKRIEILYSSASVDAKCLKLAQDFTDQIRLMRLPLASFAPLSFLFFQSPWSWVTAPTIFFCRYDFFPELLSFKFFNKKLILLSATCKKSSTFKKVLYRHFFQMIVASNEGEARLIKKLLGDLPGEIIDRKKIVHFDFRIPRIFNRIDNAQSLLNSKDEIKSYLQFIRSLAPNQKFIFGSAWPSDLSCFKSESINKNIENGSLHFLMVPHNLSLNSILDLKNSLNLFCPQIPLYEIKKGEVFDASILKSKPGIVILNMSGILCELYTQFQFAYVGGGYERSIHSVLEPYLSGCLVFVGPRIMRSTEYDYIKEIAPDEIQLLNTPESFYHQLSTKFNLLPNHLKRDQIAIEAQEKMNSIIKEIELC